MGLSIKDFTETYAEIRSVFAEDKECEHSQHSDRPDLHEGKAEWYGWWSCPHCGFTSDWQAFCDKWKRVVERDTKGECTNCGTVGRTNSVFYSRGGWVKI